jgi:hypothetical protein
MSACAPPSAIPLTAIVAAVAGETGISALRLTGADRDDETARARFLVCGLARQLTGRSLTNIGKALGGRDHTTIMHAIARYSALFAQDEVFRLSALRSAADLGILRLGAFDREHQQLRAAAGAIAARLDDAIGLVDEALAQLAQRRGALQARRDSLDKERENDAA